MARLLALNYCDHCANFPFCEYSSNEVPYEIPDNCPLPKEDSKLTEPSEHEQFVTEFSALLEKFNAKLNYYDEYDSNDNVCGRRYCVESCTLNIDMETFT
jgi:hypothetical protein